MAENMPMRDTDRAMPLLQLTSTQLTGGPEPEVLPNPQHMHTRGHINWEVHTVAPVMCDASRVRKGWACGVELTPPSDCPDPRSSSSLLRT